MTKRLILSVQVEAADDTNAGALTDALMDFVASDPDDRFPQIETVQDSWYEESKGDAP